MIKNSNVKRMKSVRDLENDLEKYQSLYDKYEHDSVKQSYIAGKISDCVRQLQLWQQMYDVIK